MCVSVCLSVCARARAGVFEPVCVFEHAIQLTVGSTKYCKANSSGQFRIPTRAGRTRCLVIFQLMFFFFFFF